MGLLNCWNWKNCGRYPGGPKVNEMGICPATIEVNSDGFLGGRAAGRACMYITGTFCGGAVQGNVESKKKNCSKCDFYIAIKKEFSNSVSVLKYKEYSNSGIKNFTASNQRWVSLKKSPEETAKAAKQRYKK